VSRARRRLAGAALVALGWLAVPAAGSAQSVDPFYVDLAREGQAELARGATDEAVRDLRFACFGMLEQPEMLAGCLVRLGLAQSALGDPTGFDETFGRLQTVEERFQVYAAARLDVGERRKFEALVVERVPAETLRSIPAFAGMAAARLAAELAKLPEKQRYQELAKRAAAEPDEPMWRLQLAALELDRGHAKEALTAIAPFADGVAEGRVACLRGLALSRLERCAEAVEALRSCAAAAAPRTAVAEVACLVALDRADAARAFAAALAAEIAADREVQRAVAKIPPPEPPKAAAREPKAKTPPAAAPKEAAAPKTPPAKAPAAPPKAPAGPPASPPKPPPLTAAELGRIASARQALERTATREELAARRAEIGELADRHPERADLQLLAGTLAYRTSDWAAGAGYFRRGGKLDPEQPLNGFYMAVCLYESGEPAAAAEALRGALPRLKRTPFVESYVEKILPSGGKKP
jgi:tetratricopeptide (TPR) repeat protein